MAGLTLMPASRLVAQEKTPTVEGGGSTPDAQVPEKGKAEEDANDAYRKSPTVRALGAKLGLTPDQSATAFEVGNFLVLAGLVGWFLVKALPKTFRGRTDVIQKDLVTARAATEDANARLGGVEARLAKLDGEIAAMRVQAEQAAVAEEQRIKASVEDEKSKILAAAEQEIAAATTLAHRQLRQYAAELAIEQASRKLVITAETDRLLVQSFARRLSGDGDKGGQN